MRYLSTILFTFAMFTVLGQWNWPVQINTNTVPPYYNYLSYYGDQNDHLQIMVTLTDQNASAVPAKLKLRIEGAGWWVETKPFNNIAPLTLEPFVPNIISGIQLQPYLLESNLIKSDANLDLNNLPEGYTNVCVEIIGVGGTLTVIAGNQCTPFWLQRFQPPQHTFPVCESVLDTAQMFHTFQWTPPIGYVPTITSELTYTFQLYEWVDPNNYTIFQTGQGLILERTNLTQNLTQVSDFDVIMQPGMLYVWRVQAHLTENGMPVNMFENNGLSEICTFRYGEQVSLEEELTDGLYIDLQAQATTQYKGYASWTVIDNTPGVGLSTYSSFFIEYRLKPDAQHPNPTWHYDTVSSLNQFIYQLGAERTYQVRVSGIAGSFTSDPTPIVEFTTPAAIDYACGDQQQPYRPPNYTPNDHVLAGNEVQIGQFMMTISEAVPQGIVGRYSGKGTIPIEFLGGARAKVTFDNILIDNDYIVREGRVDVITDGVDAWLHDQLQNYIDPIFVDGTIDSAWVDSTGTAWAVVDGTAIPFNFDPPDYPIILQDESGYQWTIYPNGTVVVEGYLDPSNDHLDVTAENAVHFQQNPNETFGFDAKEYMQWHEQYEIIELSDTSYYFVANKSIGKGETDVVDVQIDGAFTPVFKFDDNSTASFTSSGNTYTVQIPATNNNGHHTLYAYNSSNERIGKLNIYVYPVKSRKVVIVPIAQVPVSLNAINTTLQNTIGEANIELDVTLQNQWSNAQFTPLTTIELPTEPGLMNKYSAQMKDLRDHYFYENDLAPTDAYYIFVVDGFDDPNELGYMPRGKSYGFVKSSQPNFTTTLAHELGHGLGALEHSWKNNGPTKQTTNSLMDYENSTNPVKENLTKQQWKELRDIDYLPNIWDDEQDGSNATVIYAQNNLESDNSASASVAWAQLVDPIFKINDETFVRFSDQAQSHITNYGFENGKLKYVELNGHIAILLNTGYTTEKQQGTATLLATVEHTNKYNFICTDTTHNNADRTLQQAIYNGEQIEIIKERCSHDFYFGIEIEKVDCATIPGDVVYGYDHQAGEVVNDHPECPPVLNDPEHFHIPLEWRNKSDHTVCFMTPDGKTIKMKPTGVRGVEFSLGLDKADTPMMPAGCLTGFSIREDLSSDVITHYEAEYFNGQFVGYANDEMSGYYEGFIEKSTHIDTGIILLPVTGGLGAFRYDAGAYTYMTMTSTAGSILSLENSIQAIPNWELDLLGTYAYQPTDIANGVINDAYSSELLSEMTSRNTQLRVLTKILELRTQYPELYDRMSGCNFGQWGCISWTSVAAMALGSTNENIMSAALGTSAGWGYFDYCYDNYNYAAYETLQTRLDHLYEKFLFHFNELIEFNRQLQQGIINQFLDASLCNEVVDGSTLPEGYPDWEPLQIYNALNSMSVDEIKSICPQTRVNLIAILTFDPNIVSNDYEKSVYRLVHHINPSDQFALLQKLCNQEYDNTVLIKRIPEVIDDQILFIGDDDYFTLILNRLITYYGTYLNQNYPINIENLSDAQILQLRNRTISYNYQGFVKRLVSSCAGSTSGNPIATISDVEMHKVGNDWKIIFKDDLQLCFISAASTNFRTYSLLEPLIVSDEAKLIEIYDENAEAIRLPAFVLYFIEEKAIAGTAVEAIETVVDIATFFIPGGQGKTLFRILNYADKLSSLTNMAANYSQIDNPTLSKYLSLTSGVLGLADLSAGTVQSFKNLTPSSSSEDFISLISRNSTKLDQSQYQKVNALLQKINQETDPDLIAVVNNAQTKQLLIETLEQEKAYLQKLGKNSLAGDVGAGIVKLENMGVSNQLIQDRTNWLNNLHSQFDINATFTPQGLSPSSISINLKNQIISGLPATLPSNVKESIFNTLIQSGSNTPIKSTFHQGDELYKIVPKGNGYSQSSFYMSKAEFDILAVSSDIEQKLGLPLSSHAVEYDVYKATANGDVDVFESTVANTIQGNYTTTGGATQSFLLDDSKWTITLETNALVPPN